MKKAKYICLEGSEGVGKTTQVQKLVDYLVGQGKTVLQTKEPGVHHLPLTMRLREIMLDGGLEDQMTAPAREFISQAIRSIHLEKLIYPALNSGEYDYIIQDRGILSGLAYGTACGNEFLSLMDYTKQVVSNKGASYGISGIANLYDNIIILTGDVAKSLDTARNTSQEFEAGDAMEAKDLSFHNEVADNLVNFSEGFSGVRFIPVDGKDINQVFGDILLNLELLGKEA